MGAWGAGSFENDPALDWLDNLEYAEDTEPIKMILARVAELGDEYLEVDDASAAIAAAEVVAALVGRPAKNLPEKVTRWVSAYDGTIDPSLVPLARQAVARARRDSELEGLWEDADHPDDWYREVEDLVSRLS